MTGRLIEGRYAAIREMTEADAPLVVEWRNQPETARWLIQWQPLTVPDQLRWFAWAKDRGDVLLTFELKHDGQAFGAGSLYDFDRWRTCAEWGRLCGSRREEHAMPIMEASHLVHRLGFLVLGMKRTYCACSAGNTAANRLNVWQGYVKEGFRRGHLLAPDGYRDMIEYGMLAEDFDRRRVEIERLIYRNREVPSITDAALALAESLRKPGEGACP